MQVTHLGIPVHDVERSLAFYARHFGFDPALSTTYEDGTVIVRNSDRFDLALHPDEGAVASVHPFFHFGFRMAGRDQVGELLRRLQAADVPVLETEDGAGYVGFKVADPDGHRIEVYWEP